MSCLLDSPGCGLDDVFRAVGPAQTLARVAPFFPVMGITRVANVTGLDRVGIPVVLVCRPNSRSVAVSQGKGVDLDSAKASGVMESVESYHAERLQGPLLMGSLEELRYDHRLADVTRLPCHRSTAISGQCRTLWMAGDNLLGDDVPTLVPYDLVRLDFTRDAGATSGFASGSNGLASGNSKLEAVCHAICELLERDATTLWHLQGCHAATKLDTETVDDEVSCDLLQRFASADVAVGAWDTTSDSGVPSFLCRAVSSDPWSGHTVRPATGMGCHPNRAVALRRALTEAAQSRLTFISGARDDLFREDYARLLGPDVQARWLSTVQVAPQRCFADVPTWPGGSLKDAVDWLLDRLRSIGIDQAIVVDLTRPEFEVPVVKVIVPGLEGIDDAGYVLGERGAAVLAKAAA